MGPASRRWVPWSGGFITAQAVATGRVLQHRVPSAGRAVIDYNGAARGVRERALTIGGGKAREG